MCALFKIRSLKKLIIDFEENILNMNAKTL